jgi:hypothetical protein
LLALLSIRAAASDDPPPQIPMLADAAAAALRWMLATHIAPSDDWPLCIAIHGRTEPTDPPRDLVDDTRAKRAWIHAVSECTGTIAFQVEGRPARLLVCGPSDEAIGLPPPPFDSLRIGCRLSSSLASPQTTTTWFFDAHRSAEGTWAVEMIGIKSH